MATSQGWTTYACPKQSSSVSSKKGSEIVMLQESITKISWRESLHRQESAISHGSRRPQTETAAHQWKKPVVSLRQRGIKLQRKNAGGRNCKQHPYHPYLKPLSVQSAVRGAHQESVSTATNKHARTDHHLSNKPRLQGRSHHYQTIIYLNCFKFHGLFHDFIKISEL